MQQVFVISTGRLPDRIRHPFLYRHCKRLLDSTPGLIDWSETEESGTLLFFGTRAHAEKAMDAMRRSRNPVGNRIWLAEADYQTHTFHIKGPLEDQEP